MLPCAAVQLAEHEGSEVASATTLISATHESLLGYDWCVSADVCLWTWS